jgi:hypothetical protein
MRPRYWILRFGQNDGKKTSAAKLLLPLAVILFLAGCRVFSPKAKPSKPPPSSPIAEGALMPSPRLIVGRVIAIDPERRFAFVELAIDAPAGATSEGAELVSRTLELRETGRLHASRYVRGRTLGSHIVSGQPSPGDEVVWLAP